MIMKREEKKVQPVDVTNDYEMVSLGIRNPLLSSRDPYIWSKTKEERRLWKACRRVKVPASNWSAPIKSSRFPGRLIVHVRGLEKSTFSHNCGNNDLLYILNKYKTIIKAFWNGKEINPESILG